MHVWEPETGDVWEFRYKFERERYYRKNETTFAEGRVYTADERFVILAPGATDERTFMGTVNLRFMHLIPPRWNFGKPFYTCLE